MLHWPLVTPASFTIPEYAPPSGWLGHAPFAFWLIDAIRPKRIVELGVHTGFSYFCFCQAVERFDVNADVHGVDTWCGDEHTGYYKEDVFEGVLEHHRKYEFSHLHRMGFSDALDRIEDGSIDLLHIDGQHFYEDVRRDFLEWQPKLSETAIVLIHDTQLFNLDPSARVNEFLRDLGQFIPVFEFPHCYGLGVAACGSAIPHAIGPLFNGDPVLAGWLKGCYAAIALTMGKPRRINDIESIMNYTQELLAGSSNISITQSER